MASRYGGITGTEQIANDYQNINIAFENVEADVDAKAAIVSNHINDNVRHVTEAEHTKLASVQPGAEPNQNAFSRVNGMDASTPTDELTIVGDVGVTVTQNPNDKSIHLTVTGESAPGPHAATHLTGGIDPIPVATGTTSGLMPPESFQAIADNTEAINDITAQLAEKANKQELDNIKTTAPPITLSKLPGFANAEYQWNGVSFIQDNVTTVGNIQYAVWVNDSKNPVIGKRTLPNGEWSTFDLSTVTGNPFQAPTANDSHNVYVVAVDKDGYIHVAGNYHGGQDRYARSNNPHDITAWTKQVMTGVNEDQTSYPTFVRRRNGDLLYFYRNGASGSGNYYINKYDTATKKWTKVQPLFIDGLASGESPYLNHIAVDDNDVIHVMAVWRGTGNANSNQDLTYCKSPDGGVTWQKANGDVIALPITHSSIEMVIDTAATGSGIANQNGLEVDNLGRPHGACFLYDANGYTQIQHVWHDGSVWHNDTVTKFKYRMNMDVSILTGQISRPSVFTTKSGRVYIIYKHKYEGLRGTVRCIDVTPGEPYHDFEIMRLDLSDWEPTFDTRALYERNELTMLISHAKAYGPSLSEEWNDADNWVKSFAAVVTYDLDQFHRVQRGDVKIPAIKTIMSVAKSGATTSVTSTSLTDLGMGTIIITKELAGQVLFAKAEIRAVAVGDGSALTVKLKDQRENEDGSGTIDTYGSMVVTSAVNRRFYTPWMILRQQPAGDGGFITLSGLVNTGEGRISGANLKLGVLTME